MERETRKDHLTLEIECCERQNQPRSATRHGHAMGHAEIIRGRMFEFANEPSVRKLPALENLPYVVNKLLTTNPFGRNDGQQLVETSYLAANAFRISDARRCRCRQFWAPSISGHARIENDCSN